MAALPPTKDEFLAVFEVMSSEVWQLAKGSYDSDQQALDLSRLSQFERRSLVRAMFAFVEAMSYRLKQLALEGSRGESLTPAERALCREETYDLSENGKAETRPARLRFLSNVRFALRVGPKAEGSSYSPELTGEGWASLCDAVKVRDRLMHPKYVAELEVSDDEIRRAYSAFFWMNKEIVRILVALIQGVELQTSKLREIAQKADPNPSVRLTP